MKKILLLVLTLAIFTTVEAQNYKFGKISKEELSQSEHPLEPDANASILYRNHNTRFDYSQEDGFYILTEVQERIKIYNQKGYDKATIQINQYLGAKDEEKVTSVKAYTYNLEGDKIVDTKLQSRNIFEDKRSRYSKVTKFTMPDIQDGSVIEYKYTFRSPFISNVDEYKFQEEIPVDKVEMRFLTPEYLVYRTHGKGTLPLNVKREERNRTVRYRYESVALGNAADVERGNAELKFVENGYVVELSNIPAMKNEPYSGNLNNYMSALQFELSFTKFPNTEVRNYATTWEDVASKIHKSESFGKEIDRTNYYKKDIDALLSSAGTELEKVALIYDFVKKKMNWNEYYGVYAESGVKKAYKEGVGNVADINLMLISMLRYAGIRTSPILLSTKDNGIPFFPTRTGFNYVIAGAVVNNGLILLDGADKNGVPNILRPELLNWKGRMVKSDGTSRLVELYPPKSAIHNGMINLQLTDDMVLEGNVKNRFTGHYARSKRNSYARLTTDEQLKRLDDDFETIDALDISFKDLNQTSKPLTLEYNFESEEAIDEAGDKIYISPLVHLATIKNSFTSENRTHPIDYVYPWADKYIVNITIPQGYEVESLPEDLAINLSEDIGSYRFAITEANGKISLSLQNSINTAVIGASYYKDLQTYFKMIVDKESEKIVLKKI